MVCCLNKDKDVCVERKPLACSHPTLLELHIMCVSSFQSSSDDDTVSSVSQERFSRGRRDSTVSCSKSKLGRFCCSSYSAWLLMRFESLSVDFTRRRCQLKTRLLFSFSFLTLSFPSVSFCFFLRVRVWSAVLRLLRH